MAPPQYSKLTKKIKDSLDKDFPKENKVEVVTRTANNVKFTSTGTLKSPVLGELEVEYTDSRSGVTLKGKNDTNGKLTLEASIENKIAEGLKLTFESVSENGDPSNLKAGFEYGNNNLAVAGSYDVLSTTATASGVLNRSNISLGAQVEVVSNRDPKLDVTLAYGTPEFTLAVTAENKGERIKTSYLHNLRNVDATVSAEYVYSESKNTFVVAGKYNLDKTSVVKARLKNDGLISVVYTQQVRPNVNLSLSVDTSNGSALNAPKVGFVVSFNDA